MTTKATLSAVTTRAFNHDGEEYPKGHPLPDLDEAQFNDWHSVGLVKLASDTAEPALPAEPAPKARTKA